MIAIKVKITEFISNDQPGFVKCLFFDAWSKEHIVHEKIPVVTEKYLDENSDYPQSGVVACEIIKVWIDNNNRQLFTVTTEKPWDIETVEELNKFDLLEEQLIKIR